ncbi:MAG: 2-phosphosulfolactate phosphatase [Candidatus Bathyarchaeia archaeon]
MTDLKINRLRLIEGAKKAIGCAVIIDVFRAFTTAAYAFENGATRIYPVKTVDKAFLLKEENPEWILMGEVDGKEIPGFDYGNSPADISSFDFSGRTIIQRTSAGTQGILNAGNAHEIILGSFVMADAIAKYIQEKRPEVVSLVAMGVGGKKPSIEDELLAEYIEGKLRSQTPNFSEMRRRIRLDPEGAKFFDPDQPQFNEDDFHLAMDYNRFDFILKVIRDKQTYVTKIDR